MKQKRGAPKIAKINQNAAFNNIRRKVDTIDLALNQVPQSVDLLSKLPPTLTQFNKWTLAKGALYAGKIGKPIPNADLRSNGPQTLRANTDLTEVVNAAIVAIEKLTQGRRLPGERLANLRARYVLSEKFRFAAEMALSENADERENLHSELTKERARHRSLTAKSNREIGELNIQLEDERRKVAELTQGMRKVIQIRGQK